MTLKSFGPIPFFAQLLRKFHDKISGSCSYNRTSLRRTIKKPISNLIGRRSRQFTTLNFVYSCRLQSYIMVSSFEAQNRTERPIKIQNSIRFCFKFVLHYYRWAIQHTSKISTLCFCSKVLAGAAV